VESLERKEGKIFLIHLSLPPLRDPRALHQNFYLPDKEIVFTPGQETASMRMSIMRVRMRIMRHSSPKIHPRLIHPIEEDPSSLLRVLIFNTPSSQHAHPWLRD
jgi:hypothetical protein